MPKRKIIYQNWLAETMADPDNPESILIKIDLDLSNPRVDRAVREALDKLLSQEREFVIRYFFQGESYQKIAQALNKRVRSIAGLHRRATDRLRKYLAPFVKEEFGMDYPSEENCPLCQSAYKKEINKMIADKKDKETWRKIIRILKTEYNLIIKTPQILISHKKYHLEREVENEKRNAI